MTGMTGRRLTLTTLALLSFAQGTFARDVEVCANLYRRLNATPQVIGNNGDIRRYALELSRHNADIRSMRIEMRRQGCGGGSIVTFGKANEETCREMRDTLESMESARATLSDERDGARRRMQPSEERVAVLAAIRESNCTPSDLDRQTELETRERMKIQGIGLPKGQEQSSISTLGAPPKAVPSQPESQSAKIEFPPDRPYDPDRKVRMVGPQFFPEDSIDLAHPKMSGPQPQQ